MKRSRSGTRGTKHTDVQSDSQLHKHVFSLHKSEGKGSKEIAKIGKSRVSAKVVKPEEIIPLDDGELSDF